MEIAQSINIDYPTDRKDELRQWLEECVGKQRVDWDWSIPVYNSFAHRSTFYVKFARKSDAAMFLLKWKAW